MEYTEYTKFFIAIISIVDPLAALPIYFSMTEKMTTEQKQKLPSLVATAITITLLVALFLGAAILAFFGISDGSFRIASGLLLLITAYQMFQHSTLSDLVSQNNHSSDVHVVVPLAIPLLAGPGAMSTVIVYSSHHDTFSHALALALCILLLGLVIWGFFRMASVLIKKISPLTLAISSKVMGLIIAAIAVEFIANGIKFFFMTA